MCIVKSPTIQSNPAEDKKPLPILRNPFLDGINQSINSLRIGRSSLVVPRSAAGGVGTSGGTGGIGSAPSAGGGSSNSASSGDSTSYSSGASGGGGGRNVRIADNREQLQ